MGCLRKRGVSPSTWLRTGFVIGFAWARIGESKPQKGCCRTALFSSGRLAELKKRTRSAVVRACFRTRLRKHARARPAAQKLAKFAIGQRLALHTLTISDLAGGRWLGPALEAQWQLIEPKSAGLSALKRGPPWLEHRVQRGLPQCARTRPDTSSGRAALCRSMNLLRTSTNCSSYS
jgi:hypothetical protein